MNPPVRGAEHRDGLWARSNPASWMCLVPITRRTRWKKAKPYPQSPSGMTGVQTLVPIMLDHVNKGRLTLERFVDLTSQGPQRIFGLSRKGPHRGRL